MIAKVNWASLKTDRVYKRFKIWIVHFLTFHQPQDFLISGSTGWPSTGTGLSNKVINNIIHALKTFGSKSCFGISNYKKTLTIKTTKQVQRTTTDKKRLVAYINWRPKYFAYQLDQVSYFNWRIDNLNKFAKYAQQARKCFLYNVV